VSACDIVILERVKWDWFVSCTVKMRDASDVYLTKKAFALLRYLCRKDNIYFPNLPFAIRIESGRDPYHRHFHMLVGSLVHTAINARFDCMNRWCYLVGTADPKFPKGTCRVRLYDGSGGAACYLASVLNGAEYRGWTEGSLRISTAAIYQARYGACSCPAGIGALHHS